MILLAAAAILIGRFISFQPAVVNITTPSEDPLAILPPLTQLLLERLPLPVMLLDGHQNAFCWSTSRHAHGAGPGTGKTRRQQRCCAIPMC